MVEGLLELSQRLLNLADIVSCCRHGREETRLTGIPCLSLGYMTAGPLEPVLKRQWHPTPQNVRARVTYCPAWASGIRGGSTCWEHELRRPDRRLGAIGGSNLPQDRFDMHLDGCFCHIQLAGDHLVGRTLCETAQDFSLAGRELAGAWSSGEGIFAGENAMFLRLRAMR